MESKFKTRCTWTTIQFLKNKGIKDNNKVKMWLGHFIRQRQCHKVSSQDITYYILHIQDTRAH